MASVFKRGGKGSWIISYADYRGRRLQRSSKTTDKKTAERIAKKLEADAALVREGVRNPSEERALAAKNVELSEHIEEYIRQCEAAGHDAQHMLQVRSHLEKLTGEEGLTRLSELTIDAVSRNLGKFKRLDRSARTVNSRRQIVVAFANWCVKTERLQSHSLARIPKLDETSDRRRVRRALTDDELERLLAVATERGRRTWYLAASLTGLRRKELKELTWGSINLEESVITIRGSKAKREDRIPLHPELREEFLRVRPDGAMGCDLVFQTCVTNLTRQKDFRRARIPLQDENGRHVDLHALRTTLGTNLARAGVAPQVAQTIMRHSDYRTTLAHYTKLELRDAADALQKVGGIVESPTPQTGIQQKRQQSPRETGQSGAFQCKDGSGVEKEEETSNAGFLGGLEAKSGTISASRGRSSVGRASASQAEGRGFESHCPLHKSHQDNDSRLHRPSPLPSGLQLQPLGP